VLGKGFDEARTIDRITERCAQPADGGVQVVLEIYEDILRPERVLEFLAGDHLPGAFDQRHQYLEGLLGEPDAHPPLPEATRRHVKVEAIEMDASGRRGVPGMAHEDTLRSATGGINKTENMVHVSDLLGS
jgi:hypothetical protein